MIAVFMIYHAGFEDKQFFVLSGILNIIFFTWFLWRDVKVIKYLHIGQLYLVGNVFLLGIGPVYLSSVIGTDKQSQLKIAGLLPVAYLQESIFMIQLSVVFFLIGFYWIKARPRKLIKPYAYEPFILPSDIALWGLVLFSWGVRIYKVFPGVLGHAFLLVPIAVTYVFTVKSFKQPSLKPLYFFYIVVLILAGSYFIRDSVMREARILVLFPVLVGVAVVLLDRWQIDRFRKVKRSHVAISVAFVLFVLVIVNVVFPAATLKKLQSDNYPTMQSAIMAILTDEEARNATSGEGKMRLTTPLVSASIALKFRHESIAIGHDPLKKIAAGFIPRWLWRGKPIISSGGWFHRFIADYMGLQVGGSGASMALTATGELFWAYGWVGFVLGMLGYGLVIGWINQSFFKKDLRNPFGLALVLVAMMYCLKALEGGFSLPISLILILSMLAYATNKFFIGKTRGTNANQPRV